MVSFTYTDLVVRFQYCSLSSKGGQSADEASLHHSDCAKWAWLSNDLLIRPANSIHPC